VRGFSGNQPLVDDLTIIALKAVPRNLHLQAPSMMSNLDSIVAFVRDAVLPYGDETAYEMELVASELVTNVITHAQEEVSGESGDENRKMDIDLRLESDTIIFDLLYPGESFDADTAGASLPGPLEEGGRGIHIVRALVDELHYTNDAGVNHWHLVKVAKKEGPDDHQQKA
ncbi:MAG TPA: ATP-binding protein, partial [Rectinemataceae bacterium]|nr:ATP-binding protein [Rectinemataceae bacterium]